MPKRSEFRTELRLPRPLANAAKHSANYWGHSFNGVEVLFTALGVALSTVAAADEHPDAPGAEAARKAADEDFARLYAAAFRRQVPDDLFAAVLDDAPRVGVVLDATRN